MASSLHHHLLLLLLLQNSIALSFTPNPPKKLQPFIFPLKTQKIPAMSLPRPSPNKLLFHHNVSLVVTLTVGSPPQNVSMVLDTGSELSWLNCKSHSDPTHKNPTFFNPSSSHTYYPFPCASPTCKTRTLDLPIRPTCAASGSCHVYLSYADASSAEGTLSSDLFSFTPSNPSKTIFGCIDSSFSSTTSDTSSIGLIGMNRGSLSLVSQMGTPKFSYCISGRDDTGVVLLGEAELPWLLPLNYTPLVEMSLPLPYFDRGGGGGEERRSRVGVLYDVWELDLVPMEAYVIGHHHQQNVWVEYDLRGGRVGFAPVRCDIAGQRLGAVV
ncbi:Aspartic proteinase PCS1 [Acorus calamus]|uniref:Aspartic proteinase PCS1 n=1 Tax=Acorus calamus TaxID=4465 RepID=A0AAV9D9V9_ACOCL|nr:Aspartic proteinase PCS1 [Acorus calamus]